MGIKGWMERWYEQQNHWQSGSHQRRLILYVFGSTTKDMFVLPKT